MTWEGRQRSGVFIPNGSAPPPQDGCIQKINNGTKVWIISPEWRSVMLGLITENQNPPQDLSSLGQFC